MSNIIAILPEEVKGTGICARIYTTTDTYIDERTPELYLDHMLKNVGRTKRQMDKIFKDLTQKTKNTPYIIDASNVYFGFKFRTSLYDKNTRGFVNVKYVSHIEDNQIILTTGEAIDTLARFDSLNENKNLAFMMQYREIIKDYQTKEDTMTYIRARIINP